MNDNGISNHMSFSSSSFSPNVSLMIAKEHLKFGTALAAMRRSQNPSIIDDGSTADSTGVDVIIDGTLISDKKSDNPRP